MYDEKNDEVLWYNSSIKINTKTIYFKSWSKECIDFISDLIIEKHWMTYDEFENKFNVNCNFLKYFSVIHAVSTSFRNQLIESKHNRVSQLLVQLKHASKASSFTYQLMSQKNVDICIPTAQHRWTEVYESETAGSSSELIDWGKIYSMPYKCTVETKCHYFQFRFIHRILPTIEF